MRKLLLSAAASAAILSGSAANADVEDIFYFKLQTGANYLQEQKAPDTSINMKSEASYFFGVGIGYYLMDNVRVELALDHFSSPELKGTGTVGGESVTSKHKARMNALLLNGYVDLFDISVAQIYGGVGVGLAQLSADISRTGTGSYNAKAKRENNFAYALHLGASTEFAPGVNGELAYSWRDFGKSRTTKVGGVEVGKTDLRGHHVTVGVRFDI